MRRTLVIAVSSFAAIALLGGLLQASGAFAANTTTVGDHAVMSQPQAASTPGAATTPSGGSTPAAAGTSVTTAPSTGSGPSSSGVSPMVWVAVAGVGVVALGLMSAGWYTARRKD